MPGKVPRGSLPRPAATGFTTLTRAILDRLDRGVVLLDVKGKVLDANAIERADLAKGNGLMLRKDRLAFTDGETDGQFDLLLTANGGAGAAGKAARKSRAKADPPASKPARVVVAKTKRPGAVARQLYAGLSVEETAVRLGLSLNTVRSHLKQIFFKCEVQSQVELMHTLALGPQSF